MVTSSAKNNLGIAFTVWAALLVCLTVFLVGCNSVGSYEQKMVEVLEQGEKDLAGIAADAEEEDASGEEALEAEIRGLERVKSGVLDVTPPETLESGHAELEQFVDFLISMKEKHLQALEDEEVAGQEVDELALADDYRETAAELRKAVRELDLLDEEIERTFEPLLPPLLKGL